MTTRLAVMQRIVPAVGGIAETIVSSTTNSAILNGLAGGTGDDSYYVGWPLFMPNASGTADQARAVSEWDDSAGEAKWVEATSGAPAVSSVFMLMPKFSWNLTQLRNSVNETLRETKRSIRTVIPTTPDQSIYWLGGMDWVRGSSDIIAVYQRHSPNMLDNENFERWQNGDASAPDSWTLAGIGAVVARTTSYAIRGPFAASLSRSSADATLTQSLPQELVYYLAQNTETLTLTASVHASVASAVRIGINNGSTTTYSSYHTGGGGVEFLTVSTTLTATATDVKAVLSVDTTDDTATWSWVGLTVGSEMAQTLLDAGSSGYSEEPIDWQGIGVGSPSGAIQLVSAPSGYRQLVVLTRRPYAEVTSDTATIDCPAEVLETGAIYRLASRIREGQSREHLDALARVHGPAYSRLAARLIENPTSKPFRRVIVRSA